MEGVPIQEDQDQAGTEIAAEPYETLYRRFRPQRFSECVGQELTAQALRNAVETGKVGHAYLFSGPRGTGKTSLARVLANALNCTALENGEPCGKCEPCRGGVERSLSVRELDAASNSGVDNIRDLIAGAALSAPGRAKVYIIDEVHMLSTAASNALLKTLEEPPGHVVFVLATTDPQKVLPTVKSRTQHFEFRLISGEAMTMLLGKIAAEAGLDLPAGAIDAAVERGRGSARDALSALETIVASGSAERASFVEVNTLVDAITTADPKKAFASIALAIDAGIEPRRIAEIGIDVLRTQFIARLTQTAPAPGPSLPVLVRTMEALGQSIIAMRDASDPRVTLELTVANLTAPGAEVTLATIDAHLRKQDEAIAQLTAAVSQLSTTPR